MNRTALKRDPVTRDISVIGGKLQYVNNIDVVLQNCDHSLRQQLGELQYQTTKGVEYLNNVFNGTPNYQLFQFEAIRELEFVDGVERVLSFEYNVNGNTLEYNTEILTEYGTATLTGVTSGNI